MECASSRYSTDSRLPGENNACLTTTRQQVFCSWYKASSDNSDSSNDIVVCVDASKTTDAGELEGGSRESHF